MADEAPQGPEKSLPYKLFQVRHPSYDACYWKKLRALYSGLRQELQEDAEVMRQVFPPFPTEDPDVYKQRVASSLYIPYAGGLIDFIVAALSSDPLTVEAEPELPSWYKEFFKETSRPGGKKVPIDQFMRKQIRTALICRRAWTLVDLPRLDAESDEDLPKSLAEQEQAGALDAYLCAIEPENVVDWEEDEDGRILWAIVLNKTQRRKGLTGDRSVTREEYTYYDSTSWARYAIEYTKGKEPTEETPVPFEDGDTHSFGVAPLVPLELDAGLWAMAKVEQLAVAHFNTTSALLWGEKRSLFQFLVMNLADEASAPLADPNRSQQRIGPGRAWVGSEKDTVGYVGPDAAPFMFALEHLNNMRDEMHRVLHSMAQSVDNSGAALQRSGASKAQDQAVTTVVLKALGTNVREHADSVMQMVERGRDEADKYEHVIHGLEEFDNMSIEAFLEEAATLEEIDIPSETFHRRYKYSLAKRALGPGAEDEDLDAIREELEENITADRFDEPDDIDILNAKAALSGGDVAPGAPGQAPGAAAKPAQAAKAPAAKAAQAAKAPKAKPAKPAK